MSFLEAIGDQTPVQLGAVIAVVMGAGTALWWLIRGISEIRDDVRDVKADVTLLREETRNRVNGSLRREDFIRWLSKLQALNADLKLPEDAP